jgi:hypothetical protein
MKIFIKSIYTVEIVTTKGDKWLGLFHLKTHPTALEIVQALTLASGHEINAPWATPETKKKWRRLQDVVEFSKFDESCRSFPQKVQVVTPGKNVDMGTLTISITDVFVHPDNTGPGW